MADENGHLKFGGVARLAYDISSDRPAEMQLYDVYGRKHSTPPKRITVDKLPALMFQMIDEGYEVSMEVREGPVRVIIAVSKEWLALAKIKYESEVAQH